MDQKELNWHRRRVGLFTASELWRLMSASGKWTKTNKDYLIEKSYEIERGIPLAPPDNSNFREGRKNEPYAVAWWREHEWSRGHLIHCDVDLSDKVFFIRSEGFGFSPDAWVLSNIAPTSDQVFSGWNCMQVAVKHGLTELVEIKTCTGTEERSKIFSSAVSYDAKRARVMDEHKWQIVGYFLGSSSVQVVHVLKYDRLSEDDELDDRSPLDESRGIVFTFTREEMVGEIGIAWKRIIFAANYLRTKADIEKIQGAWDEAYPKPGYEKNLEKTSATLL